MSKIPKETIAVIFDTARIDEVVGDFVSLKKRGVNLLGLCPFHNEKTPSFTISPAKGIFKCFGCGKGGSSVDFIMEHEHCSYPEALKYLARKYNITIEEQEQTSEQIQADNERESIFIVSDFAQKHFTENLFNTDEGKAIGLSYFKERGFTKETIDKFQLGYSLDKWRELTDAALAKGYKAEYLVKAGLAISPTLTLPKREGNTESDETTTSSPSGRSGGAVFDRFSARVIFPIHNLSGRVIAFGGRTLKADKKVAKYINSPETEIYSKSKVLYGAYFAKKSIIAEDNCYLVEGYTDVISLHQSGIENVVASSGTSLTVEQIRLIKRFTNNITILYDGDAAGIKASFRGIDLVLEEAMNVRVLLFPDNEDPDSFARKNNPDFVKEFIKKNSKDFIGFKTNLLLAETQNDPIKKAGLIHEIVNSIAIIPDGINRSVYVKECSRILDVSEQALINELNKIRRKKWTKQSEDDKLTDDTITLETPAEQQVPLEDNSCEHQEKDIIRILLNYGNKIKPDKSESENQGQITVAEFINIELTITDLIAFENKTYQKILDEFKSYIERGISPDENYFIQHENSEISGLATTLLSNRYQLSNWGKHNIIVPNEEDDLERMTLGAINSLKEKKVMQMIEENQKKIKEEPTYEGQFILVEEQKKLIEYKQVLNSTLKRIVVK